MYKIEDENFSRAFEKFSDFLFRKCRIIYYLVIGLMVLILLFPLIALLINIIDWLPGMFIAGTLTKIFLVVFCFLGVPYLIVGNKEWVNRSNYSIHNIDLYLLKNVGRRVLSCIGALAVCVLAWWLLTELHNELLDVPVLITGQGTIVEGKIRPTGSGKGTKFFSINGRELEVYSHEALNKDSIYRITYLPHTSVVVKMEIISIR